MRLLSARNTAVGQTFASTDDDVADEDGVGMDESRLVDRWDQIAQGVNRHAATVVERDLANYPGRTCPGWWSWARIRHNLARSPIAGSSGHIVAFRVVATARSDLSKVARDVIDGREDAQMATD